MTGEDGLESLMLLNCEKDIDIDTFAATSDLLNDSLILK